MHRDFLSRLRSFVKEIISEQEQKIKALEKPRDEEIDIFDLAEQQKRKNEKIDLYD
ncbi:hypothetical protein SAMN04487767_106238 [Bacillus wiedmannii]|uniref:Uncharacterized protein n=2 Tax=Bacillus TaxID=1386 RepID=A0A1G6V8A3_9BACI|nr:hypothetical protein [Bacillus wiedmannii]SDD49802.1 hypothetical protein SAMN04487767_106238 [Bacillus wiedmannii]